VQPEPSRAVVVSDLHLGPETAGPSPAAARFFGRLAQSDLRPDVVIVLGDFLDLCRAEDEVRGDAATLSARRVERLDRIIGRHPELMDALAFLVRLGVRLEIVLGNHDLALADPAAAARLRDRLAATREQVPIRPRFALLPGLLYAEHGHQYHDLNTVRRSAPLDSDGRLGLPPVAYAEAGLRTIRSAVRGSSWQSGTEAGVVVASLADLSFALVAELAARPLLPHADPAPAGELGRLRPLAVLPMIVRVSGAVIRNGGSPAGPRPPVAQISAALRARGAAVPVLVFAHTHVPGSWPISGVGGPATYLDSGAWINPDGDRYPFVLVEPVETPATRSTPRQDAPVPPGARLLYWNDSTAAIDEPEPRPESKPERAAAGT
jgi:hypothetical protein